MNKEPQPPRRSAQRAARTASRRLFSENALKSSINDSVHKEMGEGVGKVINFMKLYTIDILAKRTLFREILYFSKIALFSKK